MNTLPSNTPVISKPYIIGYMSVDANRQYHSNLSRLQFLTSIPKRRLSFDLNHGMHKAIKRSTDDNDEKIRLLLKFLLDQSSRLNMFNIEDMLFITYRRTLIAVMCSAFGNTDPWRIVACLFNGSIYLCSFETQQDFQRRQNRTKREEKFCAWGYKFEQYMLSDLPTLQPNIHRPVIENEEFSLFYHSILGEHKLLYGAQIDGLLATDSTVPDPPEASDTDANLSYLRDNSFVELKTNREIQNRRQEQNFKRYKLLRCWCQCYLANLKGLLVGFRNDNGIIQRLQWFDTNEIVEYCKHEWEPESALMFLNYFLSYVKNCFKSIKNIYGNDYEINNKDPISLQFELDVDKSIKVSKYDEKNCILPDWYIEATRK